MLYAMLAYHPEHVVNGWSEDERDALMDRMNLVHDRLTAEGKLGPAARLGPTMNALTLRGGALMDGPFAETKEALLGFYILDCASDEAAVEAARDLQQANPTAIYELRPVPLYRPGVAFPFTEA
ncbi:MAG: YciI family protein [Caulobacteraceae bacterium]|nr:YciI family protein [Caulobacteraceae bacterium]